MSRDTEKMTDLEDGEIIQTYSIEGDSLKLESATEPIMETFNVEGENGTRLIQSYLDNFNREIQSNDTTMQIAEEDVVNEGDPGTLFIDQDGRYYFQASAPAVTEKVQDEQILSDEASTQVLINSESYQALTLVPSETLNGEVSYVLIVQQPDDKESEGNKETEADMTVYDFNENEEEVLEEIEGNSGPEDDKSKILKLPLKKSQVVAQAHMCSYCNYTSPKRYLLSRHMKSHSEERPHKCTVCERGFKTLASLQNHVNTHTGTKPHRCRFCDSAFTTSGELVRHVRYRHTHEKPHKCRECEYASVELSKLKRHVRCHTGERPYQCPHCTYASPDTFKLKRHLRTHTGEKPYQCDDCLLCFTQSNSLKAHKLTHNLNDKPIYPCELCPTTCGRKTDLRIHVQKLHTSDKPLKCKRCGKSFPDRYSFKLHNKTHEGEKCFKCEMCPYASISLRHLSSHMLIHTDEKPFACELCDQTFRQKQLLKRHQNLYHNPDYVPPCPREKSHECQECGRQFRHKGNLIRHMAIHDPESTVHEKTMALKLGRQKKIHIIGGQSVEVMHGGADSDESDDAPGAVEEQPETEELEEQQYVVLQVIHLDGNESSEQTFIQGQILETDYVEEETVPALQSSKSMELAALKMADTDKDMANCFGFDDEEAEEEETMVVEEEEEDVEKDMEDPLTI